MTTVGAVQTSTGQVHFGCLSDHQLAGKSTGFHRRRLVSTELKSSGRPRGSEIVLRSSGSVLRPFGAPWGCRNHREVVVSTVRPPRSPRSVWGRREWHASKQCGSGYLFVLLWLLQPEWKNLPHSIIFINRKWWKFFCCCCGPVRGRRSFGDAVNGLGSLKFLLFLKFSSGSSYPHPRQPYSEVKKRPEWRLS